MFQLLINNKLASAGGASAIVGVILLIVASTVHSGPVEGDVDMKKEKMYASKKRTLCAIGGALLALGVLAGGFDQYTKRSGGGNLSSFDLSSSEMSSADLESFQERVAVAASNLRKSMENASSSAHSGESSAELAARASAQISSFIQNYS